MVLGRLYSLHRSTEPLVVVLMQLGGLVLLG
jgi:hypothetical protein